MTTNLHAGVEADVIPMERAVGYARIPCDQEAPVAESLGLKHDRLFLLADYRGDITPPGNCSRGLFIDDTRILSEYRLRAAGTTPVLLSTQVIQPYHARVDLAVTDHGFGGSRAAKHAVHMQRELLLDDTLIERVTLTNFLGRPLEYWVELSVGCDFADIFEVRGWQRRERGEFFAPQVERDRIVFSYRGRDGQIVATAVAFGTVPTSLDQRVARWSFVLRPREPVELQWQVMTADGGRPAVPVLAFEPRRRKTGRVYDAWRAECSSWHSSVAVFDATLARAVDDLRSLYVGPGDGERVISAGIPWYSTVFGRDAIITSLEALPLNPRIAVDTLRYLARHQGQRVDPLTEEQPGRIMHELRRGEMARAREIPHVPYYGSVDATPLWLVLLHETWRWTGDRELVRELLPAARRALDWIDHYGDQDGDGLVEYACTAPGGLDNQGWKDSWDGVPFPDGTPARAPIALVEVQGYIYDAKTRMAALLDAFDEPLEAVRLRREAARLRALVEDRFWLDDVGTFALALDDTKTAIPTVTSNAGHLLWSRLPGADKAARVAQALLDRDMLCGWGIRTLSARHAAFNPMSYHNGSVWPHDNALIVMGLSHYGMAERALPVVSAMQDVAAAIDFNRLPELYCGFERGFASRPVLYPVSCSPQAWASAAPFLMLQGVLGILPNAPEGALHIRNPMLPSFLEELTMRNLAVGDSRVSLHFGRLGRGDNRTVVNVESLDNGARPLQVRIEIG